MIIVNRLEEGSWTEYSFSSLAKALDFIKDSEKK